MQIVDATPEEAKSLFMAPRHPSARTETVAVLALEPGKALRIIGHEHRVTKSNGYDCMLAVGLRLIAHKRQMKVTIRHDGLDLLVGRLK